MFTPPSGPASNATSARDRSAECSLRLQPSPARVPRSLPADNARLPAFGRSASPQAAGHHPSAAWSATDLPVARRRGSGSSRITGGSREAAAHGVGLRPG